MRLRKSPIGYAGRLPSVEGRAPADYQRAGNPPASSLTSDRYFKAELERPVCLQVVAGPRFEPATDTHNGYRPQADLWITAPKVKDFLRRLKGAEILVDSPSSWLFTTDRL